MIESGWDEYWEFVENPTTSVEAISRARVFYELAGSYAALRSAVGRRRSDTF
jgi:hypothetical protein